MAPTSDPILTQAYDLFHRRDFAQAVHLCKRLLETKRSHPGAHALLGQIAYEQQQWDAAVEHFRKAIAGERRNHSYYGLLATARLMQGRMREAVAAYDKALRIKPDYLDAMAGKAEALEMSGKRDRAIALLEPQVRAGRANARMTLAYVRALQGDGRHEEVVEVVDRRLGRPGVEDTFRRSLLLLQGKSLQRLGDHERAFAAFERGNAVNAQPYDHDALTARQARLREVFSKDAMAALPRARHASRRPVFIVGLPRSGSTLIEQIIHAHPAGYGAGETHDVPHLIRRIGRTIGGGAPYPEWVPSITQENVDAAAALFLARIDTYDASAERIADKSLENYENAGLLALLFPEAVIIHARRDSMDLCLSCFMQDLDPRVHAYASDLRDLGRHYRAYESMMAHWHEVLGETVLDVQYETLVSDLETESRRIIDSIGLPWEDACLRFHEADRGVTTISYDQVRRPIYATAVGRWRRYESQLAPLRAALGESGR